ncbi:unnamed protein product [Prunus armeniaca]|uniref:Uncharacterized protein n=1 Tax=Prunus armeniaca TaxID=36596 RepID=A0A6J5V502_PRUAR|nr:unnamed protein product [Prunus armeniaca]
MSGNKKMFTKLDEKFRETVKLGNDSSLKVQGKGDVKIKVNGVVQTILDVFYMPELRSNLISLGQLQEKGFAILIQKNCCQIHHLEKGLIMQVEMASNIMFPLQTQAALTKQVCLKSTIQDDTWLWHFRYGHLNFKGLKTL